MSKRRSGGIDIGGDADVLGDVVGRDKFEIYGEGREVEKKMGIAYCMEIVFSFVFTLFVAGMVLGVFGALIGAVIVAALSGGGGGQGGAVIGAGIGGILAIFAAFTNASSVSRYKPR